MRSFRHGTTATGLLVLILIFLVLIALVVVFFQQILVGLASPSRQANQVLYVVLVAFPLAVLGIIVFQLVRLARERAARRPGARLKGRPLAVLRVRGPAVRSPAGPAVHQLHRLHHQLLAAGGHRRVARGRAGAVAGLLPRSGGEPGPLRLQSPGARDPAGPGPQPRAALEERADRQLVGALHPGLRREGQRGPVPGPAGRTPARGPAGPRLPSQGGPQRHDPAAPRHRSGGRGHPLHCGGGHGALPGLRPEGCFPVLLPGGLQPAQPLQPAVLPGPDLLLPAVLAAGISALHPGELPPVRGGRSAHRQPGGRHPARGRGGLLHAHPDPPQRRAGRAGRLVQPHGLRALPLPLQADAGREDRRLAGDRPAPGSRDQEPPHPDQALRAARYCASTRGSRRSSAASWRGRCRPSSARWTTSTPCWATFGTSPACRCPGRRPSACARWSRRRRRSTTRASVSIDTARVGADSVLTADRGQIKQLFGNLFQNAIQAMPGRRAHQRGLRPGEQGGAEDLPGAGPGHRLRDRRGDSRHDLQALLHDQEGRRRPRADHRREDRLRPRRLDPFRDPARGGHDLHHRPAAGRTGS